MRHKRWRTKIIPFLDMNRPASRNSAGWTEYIGLTICLTLLTVIIKFDLPAPFVSILGVPPA